MYPDVAKTSVTAECRWPKLILRNIFSKWNSNANRVSPYRISYLKKWSAVLFGYFLR